MLDLTDNNIESLQSFQGMHLCLLPQLVKFLHIIKYYVFIKKIKYYVILFFLMKLSKFFVDSGRQLNLTHLEELHLSGNLINDSIFASLMAFPNLKSLLISYNELKGSTHMKGKIT